MQMIEACSSLSAASDLLGLDWSSLRRIVERSVERVFERRGWNRADYTGLSETGSQQIVFEAANGMPVLVTANSWRSNASRTRSRITNLDGPRTAKTPISTTCLKD